MHRFKVACLATAGLWASINSLPASAAELPPPPTRSAVAAACHPGADPQKPGDDSYPGGLSQRAGALTPQSLPGATTVSVREAKCIIDKFGQAVAIVAGMEEEERLPNSYSAVLSGSTDANEQKLFIDWLAKVTQARKDRPIIFYCHHESCFLSYNLSLRAVQGGYSQVYWMRPGISGWMDAGFALAPLPPRPGEKTVSEKVSAIMADCNKNYNSYSPEDWAGMVTQIPTEARQEEELQRQIKDGQHMLGICLDNEIRDARGAADKAALVAARAKSDADVIRTYGLARQAMEANPAKYLSLNWADHQPAKLRQDLTDWKAARTLDQTCGTFDFNQPPIGEAYNNRNHELNLRRIEYGKCIRAYYDDDKLINRTFALSSANKWTKATRRFTCQVSRQPNCIPNAPFNEVARLASDENVAFAERQEKMLRDERGRVGDLIERGNAWIEQLNNRVGAANGN